MYKYTTDLDVFKCSQGLAKWYVSTTLQGHGPQICLVCNYIKMQLIVFSETEFEEIPVAAGSHRSSRPWPIMQALL